MSAPPIGIDLGTTHTVVAVLGAEGPRIVPNALGEPLTPSVVAFDEQGALRVGAPARAIALRAPDRAAACFKRDMGTDRTHTLAGRTFTPVELSAMVLRQVKTDAEAWLGRSVEAAVVTVPAYFNDSQRAATAQAAQLADLKVLRLVNEPTAAAIAYGLHARDAEAKLVVLDLGGGTFDVTLLELFEGVVEVQASAGDNRLGGEDFTDAVVRWALDDVDPSTLRARLPEVLARLREGCEVAKRQAATGEVAIVARPRLDGDDVWRP
ncbi:MAG: Hsp70 family protein, partial [Myxococcales bacterium]|nr:Hsp70 family protein [Myxococcales bacterium]